MLSRKSKDILKFIELHKSITISQCAKTVFTGNKWAEDQARKKLRALYKEKIIQRYRANMTSEAVYYIIEKLGVHDLKLLDVYSEFINIGAEILNFDKNYRIYTSKAKKKYREIDALLEINYNGYFTPIIVEIDYTHYTSIKKLEEIFASGYFQSKYEDNVFPLILIVRPVVQNQLVVENNLLIAYSNFELKNLKQILD